MDQRCAGQSGFHLRSGQSVHLTGTLSSAAAFPQQLPTTGDPTTRRSCACRAKYVTADSVLLVD